MYGPPPCWPSARAWATGPLSSTDSPRRWCSRWPSRKATTVTAIMFTTNTTLSSLIGLAYLGDQARAGFAGPATAGFVLAITGAIGVAHDAARATSRRD